MLLTIVFFIILLVVLVSVHEWGHFWVARRAGVKVERFCVGFGKPLWSWVDNKGTEFAVAPWPLGGYVKMADATDEDLKPEDRPFTFQSRSLWQQVAILAAGPMANFVLAIGLFALLAWRQEWLPVPAVGEVAPDSLAAQAGIGAGQIIVAIDGVPTPTQEAVYNRLMRRLGESGLLSVTVAYPNSDLNYDMSVELVDWLKGAEAPDLLAGLGLRFYRPPMPAVLAAVVDTGPAAAAGLRVGDEILAVNDEPIADWYALTAKLRASAEQRLRVQYRRQGQVAETALTPQWQQIDGVGRVGYAGIQAAATSWPAEMLIAEKRNPVQALGYGVVKTWETSAMVLVSIKKLLFGEISAKNLSGPVGIAKVAGDSVKAGWWPYLSLMALMSVYLGVFNLLPIPILDGGRIVMSVSEAIKGGPLSDSTRQAFLQGGLVVIGLLTILALYNDLLRLMTPG